MISAGNTFHHAEQKNKRKYKRLNGKRQRCIEMFYSPFNRKRTTKRERVRARSIMNRRYLPESTIY